MSDEIARQIAKEMEAKMLALICGQTPKPRQTALRLHGGAIETVELDDEGKIIEPLRCICGSWAAMHRPACPFYCLST